jgi:hypothetical protein
MDIPPSFWIAKIARREGCDQTFFNDLRPLHQIENSDGEEYDIMPTSSTE